MNKTVKTKEAEVKTFKEPKTVKVKTLIIVGLWVASVAGGVYLGWNLRSMDNARITKHAEQIVQSSKLSQ